MASLEHGHGHGRPLCHGFFTLQYLGMEILLRKKNLIFKILTTSCVFFCLSSVLYKEYHRAQLTTINQFQPSSFDPLFKIESPGNTVDNNQLDDDISYFQKINRYFGGRADVYYLLGFCYYHHHEQQKAEDFFQKSIALNHDFFQPLFGLGIIYGQRGEFAKASFMFKQALAVDPKENFIFLSQSKIFIDLVRNGSKHKI